MGEEGIIGEIRLFAGNFAPRGWAFCDGQLLSISANNAAFSILGTTYGGDGRTSFGLPDLRGRTAAGAGQGPGLSDVRLGEKEGNEVTHLSTANLPAHSHTLQDASWKPKASPNGGTSDDPIGNIFAKAEDAAGTKNIYATQAEFETDPVNMEAPELSVDSVANTGGSQGYNNRQPFLGMHYIICLYGTYPSRS